MEITHTPNAERFEGLVEDQRCLLEYRLVDGVMHIDHVRVPPPLEGRGLAGELTRHVLDHARQQGLRVNPICPYVVRWMQRHPDHDDLRA